MFNIEENENGRETIILRLGSLTKPKEEEVAEKVEMKKKNWGTFYDATTLSWRQCHRSLGPCDTAMKMSIGSYHTFMYENWGIVCVVKGEMSILFFLQ